MDQLGNPSEKPSTEPSVDPTTTGDQTGAESDATTGDGLASTGAQVAFWLLMGAGAILAGVGLLLRRRRA